MRKCTWRNTSDSSTGCSCMTENARAPRAMRGRATGVSSEVMSGETKTRTPCVRKMTAEPAFCGRDAIGILHLATRIRCGNRFQRRKLCPPSDVLRAAPPLGYFFSTFQSRLIGAMIRPVMFERYAVGRMNWPVGMNGTNSNARCWTAVAAFFEAAASVALNHASRSSSSFESVGQPNQALSPVAADRKVDCRVHHVRTDQPRMEDGPAAFFDRLLHRAPCDQCAPIAGLDLHVEPELLKHFARQQRLRMDDRLIGRVDDDDLLALVAGFLDQLLAPSRGRACPSAARRRLRLRAACRR